jgi:hypothetical protein
MKSDIVKFDRVSLRYIVHRGYRSKCPPMQTNKKKIFFCICYVKFELAEHTASARAIGAATVKQLHIRLHSIDAAPVP